MKYYIAVFFHWGDVETFLKEQDNGLEVCEIKTFGIKEPEWFVIYRWKKEYINKHY